MSGQTTHFLHNTFVLTRVVYKKAVDVVYMRIRLSGFLHRILVLSGRVTASEASECMYLLSKIPAAGTHHRMQFERHAFLQS